MRVGEWDWDVVEADMFIEACVIWVNTSGYDKYD